jgi:hypothetical protein
MIATDHTQDNEVTAADIEAVEAALRKIDTTSSVEKTLLARVPQWFLVLALFKDLEISYTCLHDRSLVEPKYRAVLATLMGMGEAITAFCALNDADLSKLGYSAKMIECNVRYLRDKYEQWFVAFPEEGVQEVLTLLRDECAVAS